MNAAYGAVVAQVIPVIVLAMLLELRAILAAAAAEREAMLSAGLRPREDRLLEGFREKAARALAIPMVTETDVSDRDNDDDSGGPGAPKQIVYWNRLSGVDAFFFVWVYGFTMLILVREEFVFLTLAMNGEIPRIELVIGNIVVIVAMALLVVVAVGLELYRHFGGVRWPNWVFNAYTIVGATVLVVFVGSIAPYVVKMALQVK